MYKEDFNKFLKALTESLDYVKTDLMPDFDFDAFNHEFDPENPPQYPNNYPAATETVVEATTTQATEVIEPTNTTEAIGDNLSGEEVDKW